MRPGWRRRLFRIGLLVLVVGAAVATTLQVVHLLQAGRLRRIAATPAEAYVVQRAPVLVLDHVRVIDGTGKPAVDDQRLVISAGKVAYLGPGDLGTSADGAIVLDLSGRTVLPGLVGMHEHLFTDAEADGREHQFVEQGSVFPLMYLAAGVTTARTAGSIDPERDLRVKERIDSGSAAGPELFLTAPYLEGDPPMVPEMRGLAGAAEARQLVASWAARGMTSFKAYMNITPDEFRAAADEVHARGLRITGHLCTLGFNEAADLGIDALEHGLLTDTEFFSGKRPDECPPLRYLKEYDLKLEVGSAPIQALIRHLVERHVAIISTLAVWESDLGHPPAADADRVRDTMSWRAWRSARERAAYVAQFEVTHLLRKEMDFERAFVAAGGTLVAGADPTGDGNTLAGFGDQRELELLVEAGFTPIEAIKIATENGAEFLGIADRAGSIAQGKQADLLVVKGDPSKQISDIRRIEIVFQRGIGYSPEKLMAEIHGVVGLPN